MLKQIYCKTGPCAFALLWLLACAVAQADIYKYIDKHGRVYLTDRPDHTGYKRLVKTWKGWVEARVDYANMERNRRKYAPTISDVADAFQIPKALLHAVIMAESAFDPEATSQAGAVGLMQLMPATAKRYGVANRRDPIANISAGTQYLHDLLELFDHDVLLALAAYNAGENAVLESGRRIPPYDETRRYVRKVMEYYHEFRAASPS